MNADSGVGSPTPERFTTLSARMDRPKMSRLRPTSARELLELISRLELDRAPSDSSTLGELKMGRKKESLENSNKVCRNDQITVNSHWKSIEICKSIFSVPDSPANPLGPEEKLTSLT
jgi:hypothetical protein